MKKIMLLTGVCLFLSGCNADPAPPTQSGTETDEEMEVEIDWVDFVQWEGKRYDAADSVVLADPEFIGEKVGEVNFKVAGNVSNSAYQTRNGDAARWERGTAIYEVNGIADAVAIRDSSEVNGYSLYFFGAAKKEYADHFKGLKLETVEKVEFHQGYNEPRLLNTLMEIEEMERLFGLLEQGYLDDTYSGGDPEIYPMILYTGEPVAYEFPLFFDDEEWFWHPWDTEFIPQEIDGLIYGE